MRNIVIVGGSFAGHAAANVLSGLLVTGYRIVLIDANDFAVHWPGVVRSLVTGDPPTAPLKTETVFKRGPHVFVHARVISLEAGSLELDREFEGSTTLSFDKCILALGAGGLGRPELGTTLEEFEATMRESAAEIEKADEVLIAGGGPAGVELAGEITSRYPTKRMVLVHRWRYLASTRSEGEPSERRVKLGYALMSQLSARGVWVHVNEKVENGELVHVGTKVTADHVVWATGSRPHTAFLDAKLLAENGAVKIDEETFGTELEGVYAVGDCCSSEGRKIAAQAITEGTECAKIVLEHMKGKERRYQAWDDEGIVIPLGDKGGTYPRAIPNFTDGVGAGIVDLGRLGVYEAPEWFIRWFHRDYFYSATFKKLFKGKERIP